MDSDQARASLRRRPWMNLADGAVVLASLAMTVGLCLTARHWETLEARDEFAGAATDAIDAIRSELEDQLWILQLVRGRCTGPEQVDGDAFRAMARPMAEHYSSLQALEWVPAVGAAQRLAFEQEASRELGASFRITERDAHDHAVAAGPRSTYYPVLFVEPEEGNEGAVGFDLGSEPRREHALRFASEMGQPATTAPIELVQGADGSGAGFLTVLPVYTVDTPPDHERRRNQKGFVVAVFRAAEIASVGLAGLDPLATEVRIYDEGDEGRQLVFARPPISEAAGEVRDWIPGEIGVGGRSWAVRIRPAGSLPVSRKFSLFLLGAGLLMSGFLALHLRSLEVRASALADANVELSQQASRRDAADRREREAQRTLTTLMSNLPGLAYRCRNDPDWTMEFLSDGCLELTGHHPSELLSGDVSFGENLIHPSDRERVWDLVQVALEDRRPFQLVYRIVRKDGEERWVWEQGRALESEDGEIVALEGFVADISVQKQFEQSLIKEKRFSDSTIDSLPGVFYLFTEEGQYLRWNKNLERVTGYLPAEISRMNPIELVPEEERALVTERIAEVFEEGSSAVESGLLTKDGSKIPYFFTGRRVTLDGTPCLVGMGIDIADRKQAEAELQRERRMFIAGPAVVLSWATVEGWPVEYASPNVTQLFGHTAEDFTSGRVSYLDVIHEPDLEGVLASVAQHIAAGDESYEQDYRIVRADGEVRWISDFTVLARDEQGEVTHHEGYVLDVTERRRAQEEREEILKRVLDAQKLESVGILAGGVAHDFNNLLTTVIGNLSFAENRIADSSPAREFIAQARSASDRARDLTQQLLAYTGQTSFERRPVDLSEHIREITDLMQTSISKKVDLRFDLAEALPPVEADPAQIQQIVMNLVINGAEACGDETGVVSVRMRVRELDRPRPESALGQALEAGPHLSVVVEDTGCGMDAETLARVFDPFFTTKFTGRGLGLAAAVGIVRGHDGALEVRSTPGRGSTFEVLLPLTNRPAEVPPRIEVADLGGTGTILAADDEPALLRVIDRALSEQGYEVLLAENGREAVELFRERPDDIALVLLDMTMPEMNGAEAFDAIRAVRPDVLALLSSGWDEEEAMVPFVGAGLAGFIQKPYSPEELAAKVKDVLAAGGPARGTRS